MKLMVPDGVKLIATGFLGCILTACYSYSSAQKIRPFRQKSSVTKECGSALPAD